MSEYRSIVVIVTRAILPELLEIMTVVVFKFNLDRHHCCVRLQWGGQASKSNSSRYS